jgi:hypothetical protein
LANETTATTVTEVIERNAYAASALYFAEKPGLSNFVASMDLSGRSTLVARFPIYDKVSAAAIAENTDFTTNSVVDTGASVDVTVSEHAIKFTVTDLANDATVDNLAQAASEGSIVGRMASEALQRRQDQDIAALFSAFDSSTGSNTGAITSTLLITAIGQLDIDNIPSSPRHVVLHPFQWRTLIPSYDDGSVFGAQGSQVVTNGVVSSNLYGAQLFVTANVATATVSASTVYAGAAFHPSAVALATKGGMPKIEVERDASLRAFEVVGTGVWGEAEYRGGATTSGRGGAGVYLYSNSTAA